jgi:hypothetical protein
MSSLFQRARDYFGGRAVRLNRLTETALYIMNYVGMEGRCKCVVTCDAEGQAGQLLVVHTQHLVPLEEREVFQRYFRRKLTDLGVAGPLPLMVMIRDGDDLSRIMHQQKQAPASSARIASVLSAVNGALPTALSIEEQLYKQREEMALRRERRFGHNRAAAAQQDDERAAQMTDLGALE